jgi:hypothetical protein
MSYEYSEKSSACQLIAAMILDKSQREYFIVKVSDLLVVPILRYGYGKSICYVAHTYTLKDSDILISE